MDEARPRYEVDASDELAVCFEVDVVDDSIAYSGINQLYYIILMLRLNQLHAMKSML